MNKEDQKVVLKHLGYTDQSKTCKGCQNFVPDTFMSGVHNTHGPQCSLVKDTLGMLNVDEGGRCRHHLPRKEDKTQ